MTQEVIKSELSLFKPSKFQGAIENSQIVRFRPVSAIIGSPAIEFVLAPLSDEYYDLQNIFLSVDCKVTNQAGTDFDATQNNRLSILPYALNTMWEQVDIHLGNTQISQASNTYPYRAYIEALTSYNEAAIKTHLRSAGFVNLKSMPNNVDTDLAALTNESRVFSLFGRIHADIFNSDKLLLNGVPLHLTFIRGKDAFNFLASVAVTGGAAQPDPKLNIQDASIFVRKVKVAPALLSAHAKALQITSAKYPIKRVDVKVINLTSGQSTFVLDNVWMGAMPTRLIIGLVRHDAYNGTISLNPLAFSNYGLNYLAVNINGEVFPPRPYQPDFANDNYAREYFDFFNNLGATLGGTAPDVSYAEYKDRKCLFAFNFNADFENPKENEYVNPAKDGFMNIELHFSTNLTNALKVICWAQFDNTIEIDNNRNVTTDW